MLKLRTITDSALRALFPTRCALCGREGDLICVSCQKTFPPRLDPDSPPKLTAIRAARSVWPYEGSVREIVRKYKYNGLSSLAPVLAEQMVDVFTEWNIYVNVVAYVPIHPSRLRERGFDQAERLARELSQLVGVPPVSAVVRERETAVQARAMSAAQRADNVRGAFSVPDSDLVRRADVLLIDDVLTTGATLSEAARALRRAGARTVYALTYAHEV